MTEDTKNADKPDTAGSEDDPSTLTAIEAKMAELRGDVTEGNGDSKSKVDDPIVTDDPDPDTKDDDPDTKDDDSPMLPSGHRRAALARGFTSEEVDYYLETKPDEAIKELARVFDEWQEENSRWSDRGRQLLAAGQEASDEKVDDGKKSSEALAHYDAAALIEKHGNEDLINDLIDPLNATIDQVNAVTEKLSHSEKFLRNTEINALEVATQNFLKSKEMEPFRDTFGVEITELTDKQVKNRMELFGEADIIVAGAKDHGKDITIQNALERAHIIVSQGTRDEGIRQSIRDSLKKRTKTTKTTHQQTTSPGDNEEVSDEELEKRTADRMRAIREK